MSKACIIYIMGVAGSGKSTVGKLLSQKTGIPFFDADDFHSRANKQKMKNGKALNDEDRFHWLTSINAAALHEMKKTGGIFACSALKERYRHILANNITIPIFWIFLQGPYDMILKRLQSRKDHFMPPSLLSSQFETLEIPTNAIAINIEKTPAEIVQEIQSILLKGY
jgi:carbohydrate kinase (thermoresistant glucokinase family)